MVRVTVVSGPRQAGGYGRARMSVIPNAEAKTLRTFLINTVEPGSTVVTDGWSAYSPACRDWFDHEPRPVSGSGKQANDCCPAVAAGHTPGTHR
jgi:transposase-like protein